MEVHYIIALSLGIIAVIISIRYMTITNNIFNEIKYIRSRCLTTAKYNKIADMIKNIQDNHGLSIQEIKKLILDARHMNEHFENFVYEDIKDRNIINKKKIIDKIKILSYDDIFKDTLEYIKKYKS